MVCPCLMTLEEFFRLPEEPLKRELNNGRLETKPLPVVRHSLVTRRIFICIQHYLDRHPIGELFLPKTPYLVSAAVDAATVRGPDLSYIERDRFARIDLDQPIPGAPELAIEVVAAEDTAAELLEKTGQYLGAGGQVVWIVYPEEREVRVFEASGAIRILKGSDTIDAPALLPGFPPRSPASSSRANPALATMST